MSLKSLISRGVNAVRPSKKRAWWEHQDEARTPPRELTNDESLISLRIGRHASLGDFRIPQIPVVAAETLALLSQAEPDPNQISKLIQKDQQLAADILRFANSALFAGVMDVSNIPQAISRLGFYRTRNLILAASLRSVVYTSCELARAERLWRHSCGAAIAASRIARNLRANADDAYLAGLFHDVGKTIVLSLLDTTVLQSSPGSQRADFIDRVLDLYHEHVGVAVTRQWELPDHVINAIAHHHETEGSPFTATQAIIALANNVCWRLGIGVKDDGRPIAGPAILEALGAGEADLPTILEGVREGVSAG